MADETTTDKPLANLAETERNLDPPAPEPTVEPEPEHTPAAARLRSFEDEHFGEDAVRIDGKIERGVGSPYADLSDEDRRKYEAIERLIVAEQKLADAHTALIQADADYEAAEAAVDG